MYFMEDPELADLNFKENSIGTKRKTKTKIANIYRIDCLLSYKCPF